MVPSTPFFRGGRPRSRRGSRFAYAAVQGNGERRTRVVDPSSTATARRVGDTSGRRRTDVSDAVARRIASERARFAAGLDVELQVACRMVAAARRELGCAADLMLRGHGYRWLGFVRVADYTRELLGLSGRTVQEAAYVARRLDELPAVSTAFDRSEITWTQARVICRVATRA